MYRYEDPARSWKQILVALAALAALALAPAPAQAQICGELDDISEDLLGVYYEELGGFFTLSQESCESMTKTFHKACNTAVKDAVKCIERQLDNITKAAKPGCKENFEDSSACDQEFKNEAEQEKEIVSQEANFANADCADDADSFFSACRFDGVP